MSRPPEPGRTWDPLPPGETVFRLVRESKDYRETRKVSPESFTLSQADKVAELKVLSVWVDHLTTPQQAREFMESDKQSYRLVARFNVDQVRVLRPSPDSPRVPYLDVVWDRLMIDQDGEKVPDTRLGAEGHAGITGLIRPEGVERIYYKSLRSKLADLATVDVLAE